MIQRIGPYQIERELGRGGMGIVYLARDSRLDRQVAIKALPEHVALDPERLARFEREARSLAALNHPNVAGIYGVEEHEGHRYLILEYVEGQTLAERLDRGPLPVDEAIEYAVEIAAGIEAAHEAGVIHRDLKPDNIKITPDGKIKVLDFGLAKASETSAMSSSSQIATVTTPHSPTVAGAILGTAPYMSPEQARGRHVDKRTDIWSFGVVLYEMLTGANPFRGETATDSIGAIMHKDPDFNRLPIGTPARARQVLSRCLERDRNLRYRDIGDVRIDLLRFDGAEFAGKADTVGRSRWATAIALGVIGLLLGAAAVALLRPGATPARPIVATIMTPKGVALNLGMSDPGAPSVSPDGRFVVYSGRDPRRVTMLYLVELATGVTRTLEGTEGAQYPFWAPNSASIAFFSPQGLRRTEIVGGPPRVLDADTLNGKGGAWSVDGKIIYAPGPSTPLSVIDAGGGVPAELTTLGENQDYVSHRIPQILPRGDALIYVRRNTSTVSDGEAGEIWARTMDGTVDRMLVKSQGSGQYSAGRLLYVVDGVLVARPFDERTLDFTGEAVRVADNVMVLSGATLAIFSVAPSGALVFVHADEALQLARVQWRGRDGQALDTVAENVDVSAVRLFADGSKALLNKWDTRTNELGRVVLDLATGREHRLEESLPHAGLPVISHDGTRYAHTRREKDETLVLVQPINSFTEPEVVARIPSTAANPWIVCWTFDDRALVAKTEMDAAKGDLVRIELDGSGKTSPMPFGTQVFTIEESKDGRWVAYESEFRNERHIFVGPSDRPAGAVRITERPARRPRWRADGRELYFHADDGRIFVVRVETAESGAASFSAPEVLFDAGRSPAFSFDSAYDVAPDGMKFLVIEPMSNSDFGLITIMTDWAATVDRTRGQQ